MEKTPLIKRAAEFSKLAAAYEEMTLFDDKPYSKKSLNSSGFNALKDKFVNVYKNPNSA
ncbi:hypothetical protein WAX78_15800 [Bacillus sp. FJAT-53711]|uniref:Uncharacterized protein n=1 Tax=Bacillus yunxiaonensis TaxID=3127665 RepID=A0ABU8FYB2_9BACI